MEPNDHDLLIRLSTLVEGMDKKQDDFINRFENKLTGLMNRVAILENQDSRDSEKFKGLADEIRRSLANAARIDSVASDLNNLGNKVSGVDIRLQELDEKVEEVRKKSTAMDLVNFSGATLAGIIGYFFGNK